jgi:predicted Zn-dependent protease with MMP-like domain
MKRGEFEKLVAEGVDEIPEKFLKLIENVAIVVEDEPSIRQRRELKLRKGHSLLGLYEGVPRTAWGRKDSLVMPDKITIFMIPILEVAESGEDVRTIVRDTVWHEIAHHFGLDEREVRASERKRKKT